MKNLSVTAILVFYVLMATAQTKYGLQASGIMSTASFNESGNDNVDRDLNRGFGAGVFAEIPVGKKFSIKPGLNYMQKGVKVSNRYTEDGMVVKQNIKTNLNYLEVPVLAIYNVNGMGGKWFFGAGPSAGYGVSGKLKGDVEFTDESGSYKESFKVDAFKKESDNGANFKRLDMGLEAVAGHNINKNLAMQLNYIHGLSNIANTSDFNDSRFKNRNILLSLNYRI